MKTTVDELLKLVSKEIMYVCNQIFTPVFIISLIVTHYVSALLNFVISVFMYIYLKLYIYRLGVDTRFMIKEALENRERSIK